MVKRFCTQFSSIYLQIGTKVLTRTHIRIFIYLGDIYIYIYIYIYIQRERDRDRDRELVCWLGFMAYQFCRETEKKKTERERGRLGRERTYSVIDKTGISAIYKLRVPSSLGVRICVISKLNLVYIYIYIYVVHSIGLQTLFCTGIYNYHRLLNIQYVIAIHLIRWLTNFYDFKFKWTATTGIGMHPTKV